MLTDGTRTFEWDAENRLVSVTIVATGHRSEFTYDGLGRRVEIVEKDPDQTQTLQTTSDKKYLWVGTAIAEERAGADGGTVTKRYFGQGFIDTDGTKLLYTQDHLGNVRELVDMSQNVQARYEYDSFGRATKVSGPRSSDFLYTGHFWHAQSGLYLTLHREYDPNLGRWLSRDPMAEGGGLNLYAYVGNNPIRFSDPLGLDGFDDVSNYSGGVGDFLSGGFMNTGGFSQWAFGHEAISITQAARMALDIDQFVDKCSNAYTWGKYSGAAILAALLGATAAEGAVSYLADLRFLRIEYMARVRNIANVTEELLGMGAPEDAVAKFAYEARLTLGIEYKAATPLAMRAIIYGRNLIKYGAILGPSFDRLMQTRGAQYVINAASRPGGQWFNNLLGIE